MDFSALQSIDMSASLTGRLSSLCTVLLELRDPGSDWSEELQVAAQAILFCLSPSLSLTLKRESTRQVLGVILQPYSQTLHKLLGPD